MCHGKKIVLQAPLLSARHKSMWEIHRVLHGWSRRWVLITIISLERPHTVACPKRTVSTPDPRHPPLPTIRPPHTPPPCTTETHVPTYSAPSTHTNPRAFTSRTRRAAPAARLASSDWTPTSPSRVMSSLSPSHSSSYAASLASKKLCNATVASYTAAARTRWVAMWRNTFHRPLRRLKAFSTTERIFACWWLNLRMDTALGPWMSTFLNGVIWKREKKQCKKCVARKGGARNSSTHGSCFQVSGAVSDAIWQITTEVRCLLMCQARGRLPQCKNCKLLQTIANYCKLLQTIANYCTCKWLQRRHRGSGLVKTAGRRARDWA